MQSDTSTSGALETGQPIGKKEYATLAAVLAFALLLRVAGLTWGLPNAGRWYSYHPDESPWQIVGAVITLVRDGGWNPHFFNYPSLTIYATYAIYMVMASFGLTTNVATQGYPWNVSHDVILAGRTFTALCGAGTAVATYLLVRKAAGPKAALLASLFMALAPGHVQHSHFATVDVPATFFVVCALALAYDAKSMRTLVWAAVLAGLAAGAKYNAGLVLVAPLVGLWLMPLPMGKRLVSSVGLIAITGVVFLLTTPYAVLSFPEFWGKDQNGFAYELLRHPREGSGDLFTNTGNGWWYHLTFNLPFAATWPLLVLGLAGLGLAAKDRKFWPLIAFLGLFFLTLGTSQVRFMRYVLPLVPGLCLGAAVLISQKRVGKLVYPLVVLAGLMLVLDLAPALGPLVGEDPRDQAVRAVRNEPEAPKIALLGNPWFFTPPFQPMGFNGPVSGMLVTGTDIEAVKRERPLTFVISEFEYREKLRNEPNGEMAKFLETLKLARNTSGSYASFGGYHVPWQRSFVPTDYLYTNPEVRVYYVPG